MTPCANCPHDAHPERVCDVVTALDTDDQRRIRGFTICGCLDAPRFEPGKGFVVTRVDVLNKTIWTADAP